VSKRPRAGGQVPGKLVSVAVPVAVDRGFTYRVPDTWAVVPAPGTRVLVPFGQRAMVGVVRPHRFVDATHDADKIKPVWDVLDPDGPALTEEIVELCEWMTEYYLGPVGEVYRLALPGLLTNADARVAVLTDAGRNALGQQAPLLEWSSSDAVQASTTTQTLPAASRKLLAALAEAGEGGLPVSRLSKLRPRIPSALRVLAELERAGLCATQWDDGGVQSRSELHIRRTDYLRGGGGDEAVLQRAVGRSKQRRALLDDLESRLGDEDDGWIAIGELRGPFPRVRQLLPELVKADLVRVQERPRRLDPFATHVVEPTAPQHPTPEQAEALTALHALASKAEASPSKRACAALLHGVTGSGKTEVYLQLIATLRARDRGAIVLVPEIALTPQLSDRFRARFGDEVAVLHSGLTPRQRLDAWQQIRTGSRPIVIGARSAIFAPLPRLGTIVVDEEHDPSFKQEEGIRYNARDVALVRGRAAGAVVVLGSATPSLESYEHARAGRTQYLRLHTRPAAASASLPQVEIVPLSVHRPDPESLLTGRLRDAVRDVVHAGEQAILFLNRRGFTTTLICTSCGSLQQCPDCSAPSMTYHLARNRLMCHLCGHIEAAPERCRACEAGELVHGGVGTERVELALQRDLPGVRVLRLDRDATRGRQLLRTLARFREGDADVLVGTQMLSKGHDFPGVTLVGILQGDQGLALPDPRAAERTFGLLTQVAGRAGRGDRAGRVLVQAYAIEHPAITFAAQHDYVGFAEQELASRLSLGNPPFGHLALLRVHGIDAQSVQTRAEWFGSQLRRLVDRVVEKHQQTGTEVGRLDVLGPVASPLQKVNGRTRWQLLVRAEQRGPLRWLLTAVRPQLGSAGTGAGQTLATIDVDPQSFL
jgi:primosomal protein N' (replication factor Y) (superfamily II helicase)